MSQPDAAALHRPVQVNKITARACVAHGMLSGFHIDVTASHLPLGDSDRNSFLPGTLFRRKQVSAAQKEPFKSAGQEGGVHQRREDMNELLVRGIHRQRVITMRGRRDFTIETVEHRG